MSLARQYQATPEIKVGDKLTISGVGNKRDKKFDGDFVITAVSGRYLNGRTAAAMKPWEAEGISRATWYRRKKEQKK